MQKISYLRKEQVITGVRRRASFFAMSCIKVVKNMLSTLKNENNGNAHKRVCKLHMRA